VSASALSRPFLTVAEVAARLGIDERTVRRWIVSGRLPAIQLGGPRAPVRIPVDEFDAWLETRRTPRPSNG
jgi:excisionase family DNA binding protein